MYIRRFTYTCILFGFLSYLLLFPAQTLSAARQGLQLWYQNLVPTLLPFMVLSGFIVRTDLIFDLLRPVWPVLHLLFGTTGYGSYAVLAGFLFGCPMGAKVTGDLKQQGLICPEEARYLMHFVNNLGPAFLISYVVTGSLRNPALTGPTLIILYGSSLLTGQLDRILNRKKYQFLWQKEFTSTDHTSTQKNKVSNPSFHLELLDTCVFDSIRNITRLGVYLMLCSIFVSAVNLLPVTNTLVQGLISGCIEVTTGIQQCAALTLPLFSRYLCIVILCSFGGICICIQTLSVYRMSFYDLLDYMTFKLITVCISISLTFLLFF